MRRLVCVVKTHAQPPSRCRSVQGRSPSHQLEGQQKKKEIDKVSFGAYDQILQSCSSLTVLESVGLAGPAVLDYEWDTIVELKADLLGSTRLEAVKRVVRLETEGEAGKRASVKLYSVEGCEDNGCK